VAAEKRLFLFSGLLREYKGWDVLLEAFRPLASEFPEALLVLAGEPWGAAKELASRGAGPSVRLELRYLPEEERALWFCAADAVVCPYRSATGSGIAADAIGFGKPLLGTRVPGLTEVVSEGESGLLCEPGDVSGLRSILERFLREDLCVKLSQGARRLQETFSPLSHARSVAEFGGVTL
jgi:glycosyltransferase involved in cell wall biosynthesis